MPHERRTHGGTYNPAPIPTYKVVLIGDAGVGKTSLRLRYLNHKFQPAYRATLGADFHTRLLPNLLPSSSISTHIRLQIWDTAGSERFRSLGPAFYRGADACVLTYSCADRDSLVNLKQWKEEFVEKRPLLAYVEGEVKEVEETEKGFVWAVVGCKADLLSEGVDAQRELPPGQTPVDEPTARSFLAELFPFLSRSQFGTPTPSHTPLPPLPISNCDFFTEHDRTLYASTVAHDRPVHPHCINGASSSLSSPPSVFPVPLALPHSRPRSKRGGGSLLPESESILSIYHTPPSSVRSVESRGSGGSAKTIMGRRRSVGDSNGVWQGEGDLAASVGTTTDGGWSQAVTAKPSISTFAFSASSENGRDREDVETEIADALSTPVATDSTVLADNVHSPNNGSPASEPTDSRSCIPLFITSSLLNQNVDSLFAHIAEACARGDERRRKRLDSAREDAERRLVVIKSKETRGNERRAFMCCG